MERTILKELSGAGGTYYTWGNLFKTNDLTLVKNVLPDNTVADVVFFDSENN